MLSGCGVRPKSMSDRSQIVESIPKHAQEFIAAGELPDQAPLRSVELIRAIFLSHPELRPYLPSPLTLGELQAQSLRRPGRGYVGDLIIFKRLPNTLEIALVTEVMSSTRYRAVGILLGSVKQIELDLAAPSARRREGEVINTVIRRIKERDKPPHLYLAGELFVEFRSLF